MQRCAFLLPLGFLPALLLVARAHDIDPQVAQEEAKRVAAIAKARPSVVAIFAKGGQGGGSGVLVDAEGFALTNFHVVAGSGPVMQCGLPDGVLYDAVLVGLDKVGDVALIKLLPKKEGQPFPFARMADSDKVKAGDWALAMGNPFLLATDFSPTVTYGMVSGVNRYQYPSNGLLEYTDCIQVDASINPGNSGGPLFDMQGELIGINGRISLEKRGRVNVGVGYAISINQIKNFMGHFHAGLDADHASLGAVVTSDEEDGSIGRITVTQILEGCDADRRGLNLGDELLKFNGRDITTVNQFKNVIGLYPRGWRLPLRFRHQDEKKLWQDREVLVRLMGVQRKEIKDSSADNDPKQPNPQQPKPPAVPKDSPAAKFYEAREGFANYYFNKEARERLLTAFGKFGDFKKLTGKWVLSGDLQFEDQPPVGVELSLTEGEKPTVSFIQGGNITFDVKPLEGETLDKLRLPPESGGLLMALYQYRQLLTLPSGEKTFLEFTHGGHEPYYVPGPDKSKPDYAKERIDTEVIHTQLGAFPAKWFFTLQDETRGPVSLKAHTLAGFEVSLDREEDPCEVYLADYRPVQAREFPHRIEVRYKDKRYGTLTLKKIDLQ